MKRKSSRKKNTLSKIIIILIVICLLVGLGYYFYNMYMDKIEKENMVNVTVTDDLDIEINSEVKIENLIDNVDNGTVLNNEELIDTSKLGKVKVAVLIKNKKEEEEQYEISINIVDTEKPVIEAKKEITSYIGNKVDLLKNVSVKDNSKEDIKASVEGEYYINKVSDYKLKYVATDSSGNKSEYDFVLKVIADPNNRTFTTSKGYTAKVVNGITYIDGVLIANKTYSLPSTYAPGLLNSTKDAFNKMSADASTLGFNLFIGSGYRSYYDQKYLYNNYVARDGQTKADTYSARAGHSEHQSGLAIDICDRNVASCVSSGFDNSDQAKWLSDNCYRYGFILRYPKGKESITGYMYESWHMRYVGVDLATKLYNNGSWITLEEYYGIDSKYS